MNNAKRERVKRIIKCMKFQLIFNRLLINLQLKWLINGCSTYWYIYECIRVWATKWFNRYADRSDQTNKSTRMTNGRSCHCRAGYISNNNTHTQQRKGKRKIDRMPQLTKWFIEDTGHGDNHRASERGACKHLLEINKSTRRERCDQPGTAKGEAWRASEKNFMWQVKWKFLHKSKLKVLKIAKGLKLNFTILTSAKGCSTGRG